MIEVNVVLGGRRHHTDIKSARQIALNQREHSLALVRGQRPASPTGPLGWVLGASQEIAFLGMGVIVLRVYDSI